MLSRGNRLRSARAFRRIYEEGVSVSEPFIVLYVLTLTDRPQDRLVGFSVSKKVGNAVVRNRVRRRLRAIVRELLPRLAGGFQAVVVARQSAGRATFADLRASMERAFSRAGLLAMTSPMPPAKMPADPAERAVAGGEAQ